MSITAINFSDSPVLFQKIKKRLVYAGKGLQSLSHTETTLLNLTGGIPLPLFNRFTFIITMLGAQQYKLEIRSNIYQSICWVNFEKKYLFIHSCEVYHPALRRRRTGAFIFINMVKEARLQGLTHIDLYAAGNYLQTDIRFFKNAVIGSAAFDSIVHKLVKVSRFNGYYTCARFGCIMLKEDQENFERWKEYLKHNPPLGNGSIPLVNDLVKGSSGQDLWKKAGFSWSGIFLLDDNSLSMKYLEYYMLENGISVTGL